MTASTDVRQTAVSADHMRYPRVCKAHSNRKTPQRSLWRQAQASPAPGQGNPRFCALQPARSSGSGTRGGDAEVPQERRKRASRAFVLTILQDEIRHLTPEELDAVYGIVDAEVGRRIADSSIGPATEQMRAMLDRQKRSSDEGE